MQRLFSTLIILFLVQIPQVKAQSNFDNVNISVLTCASGEELYSLFGHTAIRIHNTASNQDVVYNYGTFDFNTPNFYLKFANGQLNYSLSASTYNRFMQSYFMEERSVQEQILNLNNSDKKAIILALNENYKKENRNYKYDFFYDNCATRVYDIITDNIENDIQVSGVDTSKTFRDYLHIKLHKNLWTSFGLDFLLGAPADKYPNIAQTCYLPDNLFEVFSKAKLSNGESLVKSTNTLLQFDDSKSSKTPFLLRPSTLGFLLLLIVVLLSYLENKKKLKLCYFDIVFYSVISLVGMLLFYLWFITEHQVPKDNYLLLFTSPICFLLLVFSKKSIMYKALYYIHISMLLIFILGWFILPQQFQLATLPIAITLFLRIFVHKPKKLAQ